MIANLQETSYTRQCTSVEVAARAVVTTLSLSCTSFSTMWLQNNYLGHILVKLLVWKIFRNCDIRVQQQKSFNKYVRIYQSHLKPTTRSYVTLTMRKSLTTGAWNAAFTKKWLRFKNVMMRLERYKNYTVRINSTRWKAVLLKVKVGSIILLSKMQNQSFITSTWRHRKVWEFKMWWCSSTDKIASNWYALMNELN